MGHLWKFAMLSILPVVLLVAKCVVALDEDSAKEAKCFDVGKTMPVDGAWLGSQKVLYYPLMSRLNLYRTIQDLTQRPFRDITEKELYYDSCIQFSIGPTGSFLGDAYGGRVKKEVLARPKDPGLEQFDYGPEDPNEPGLRGTCYTTLTDNKSFMFYSCCSNGNEMFWATLGPVKKLPKETENRILQHARSLGFNPEHFTGLQYDSCEKGAAPAPAPAAAPCSVGPSNGWPAPSRVHYSRPSVAHVVWPQVVAHPGYKVRTVSYVYNKK